MLLKTLGIYFAFLTCVSLIAFAVYGWDKRQAGNQGERISEKRLHQLAAWGGWPGALMGQSYFRHKTSKPGFRLKTWAIGFAHLLLAGLLAWILSFAV